MAKIYGTAGNDRLTGTSSPDWIYGYPEDGFPEDEHGDDILRGGDGNDRIYGGGGNDTLRGDDGADHLFGGDGDDVLQGGAGFDRMEGGAGNDTFLIGDDQYDEFRGGAGTDTVRLEADGAYQEFLLGEAASVEILDLAGFRLSGSAYANEFDLSGLSELRSGREIDLGAGNDRFTGHAGVDLVRGGDGNDRLSGGAGNDILSGGEGADTYDGGAGDDTFLISHSQSDTFQGGAGTDTVRLEAETSRYRLILDAAAGVERLDLAGRALTGSSAADIFDLTGIERIRGQTQAIDLGFGNDRYLGHDGTDRVAGGGGADRIEGRGGNDVLDGGTGADELLGGAGDDRYIVDDRSDLVSEEDGSGTDTVASSVSFSLTASPTVQGTVEHLELTGRAAIDGSGNGLANRITGNNAANQLSGGSGEDTLLGRGGNDRLDGGRGADRMTGGTGDDTYVVDHRSDRVSEAKDEGYDTVLAKIDYRLAAHVETLTLQGDATKGTGNALSNRINGNDLDNHLWGGDGHDRLRGGAGTDRLEGGNGRDSLTGGAGADWLTGGDGADSFIFDQGLRRGPVDRIVDFDRGEGDRVLLDREVFAGLRAGALDDDAFRHGTSAADGEDRFIYDRGTGRLWFDADGAGGDAQQLVAVLENHARLGADQLFLV